MEELIKIIGATCLKHHDSGEASCNREARLILQALADNGYRVVKIIADQPDVTKSLLKWAAVKNWLYEFWHGHPFLLEEETEIIVQTRLYDMQYQWMNDIQIQDLIKIRVKEMYKKKF